MKKMMLATAVLAAGMAMADVSSQVVGYNTTTIEAGKWYLLASQFQKIGSGTLSINDVIDTSALTPGSSAADAPCIQVWQGGSFTPYYYLAEAEDDDFNTVYNVWADNGTATSVSVDLAAGIFFKSPVACTITSVGQVVSANSTSVTVRPNQWNLIANPYPAAFALNGNTVDWLGALTPGTTSANAPCIQIWTGTSFSPYYLLSEAEDDDFNTVYNVWADNGTETTASVNVGKGFFLKFPGTENKTITFNK